MTENIVDINDDRIDEYVEEVLYVTHRIDELMASSLYAAFEYGNKYEQLDILTRMIRLMMGMSVEYRDMLKKNGFESFASIYGIIGTSLDETRIRIMKEILERFILERCQGIDEDMVYTGFIGDSLDCIAIDEDDTYSTLRPNSQLNLLADAIMYELGNEPLFNGTDSSNQWYEYAIEIGECYIPSICFWVDGDGHGYALDDDQDMYYIPIGCESWKAVVEMALDWKEKEKSK